VKQEFEKSQNNAGDTFLTREDQAILNSVDQYLAGGLALKRWWKDAEKQGKFEHRFELERTLNRPSNSYGFFDRATVEDADVPIMGNVQDMLLDRPKSPALMEQAEIEWTREQLREFVLHYFMRVSSFRGPEAVVSGDTGTISPWLKRVSWCDTPQDDREGFGFSQLYYKTVAGEIGKFADTSAIVDMRDIGDKYEWIVLKVRIFNFSVPTRPFGEGGPEVLLNLDEESYVVVSRDFILDKEKPAPEILGEYGIGYAFIKLQKPGFLAFGPGEFAIAMQLIQFQITETGDINVHMPFIVNRPTKVANLPIDPVDWAFRLADFLSLGMAAPILNPMRAALARLPLRLGTVDPVYGYIDFLNLLTNGQSRKKLCISKEQLNKKFLVQHFMQHYGTLAGALFTWRQIPDWLDSSKLPQWVVTGRN
jgi:hypothetical protein